MKANFRCKEPFGTEPPAVGGGGVSLCGPVAKASGLECSFSGSASASPVGPSPPWKPPCWLSSPPAAPDQTQRQTDKQAVSRFSSSPAAPCALQKQLGASLLKHTEDFWLLREENRVFAHCWLVCLFVWVLTLRSSLMACFLALFSSRLSSLWRGCVATRGRSESLILDIRSACLAVGPRVEGRPEWCPSYWTHGWALSEDRQSRAV